MNNILETVAELANKHLPDGWAIVFLQWQSGNRGRWGADLADKQDEIVAAGHGMTPAEAAGNMVDDLRRVIRDGLL